MAKHKITLLPGDGIGPEVTASVVAIIECAGVEVESAELTMEPKSVVEIDEAQAGRLMRMLDALDDHDDVEAVHANFDVPADVLERAAT